MGAKGVVEGAAGDRPLREHLNVVGNYTFALPDLGDAGIRPLRDPDAPDDEPPD